MNDYFLMLKEIKITIEYLMIKVLPGDDSINYIYKKQNFHDCVLTGKTKYYSNLINTNSN